MSSALCPHCGNTAALGHVCPAASEKLVGKLLDGRYRLEAVIGEGGMGSVYRAIQIAIQRPVAVKTLHPSLATSQRFFERFRREAELASKLRHPNIITIYDFGRTEDGTCYIVMELIDGESVRQTVRRQGPMSLRRAVDVVEQAARGLAHAHATGCIHRDLKPHNLMIHAMGGREFVKVLDFGLVKVLGQEMGIELTSTGQVLGTPQYMPPEQAGGEVLDARADLYSLGAVLFFCLTGTSPYGANSVRKALTAALTQPIPSVATRRAGAPVPAGVDTFLQRALARDKKERPGSVEEFVDQMLASVEDVPDDVLDALPGPLGPHDENVRPPSVPPPRSRPASQRVTPGSRPTPRPVSVAPVVVAPPAPVDPALDESQRLTSPEHPRVDRRRRVLAWMGGGVGLLLLGAGTAWVMRGQEEELPAEPLAELVTRPSSAAAQTPPAPAAPEVVVSLHSSPEGAEVFEGRVQIGTTPTELRFTRAPHTLTFRLAGRDALERSLDLSRLTVATTRVDIAFPASAIRAGTTPSGKKKKASDAIPVFE